MQWSAILELRYYRDFHVAVISGGIVMLSLNRCWEEKREYDRSFGRKSLSDDYDKTKNSDQGNCRADRRNHISCSVGIWVVGITSRHSI